MNELDTDNAADEHELRRAPRRRQLKSAKLIVDKVSLIVDCRLRDISLTGAGIECDTALAIPDDVSLKVGADAPLDAVVVWRVGNRIGLKFKVNDNLAEMLTAMSRLHEQFDGPLQAFLTLARQGRLGDDDPALNALGNATRIYDELGRIAVAGGEMLKSFDNITGKTNP